ncbi:cytoplasmic protein [Providencia alcalifaciens]|uniref:cytoplasmic protein n=1 Tax=Providencia alcalifaciens TaxID=126385 RepID=UPI0029E111FB|nr:cytoplasmic protein [Providencia rettgeri]
MAIPTEQLLGILRQGYTITTFYRLSAKAAFQSSVRIPEGYLLLSQNGEEEGVLTHIEFQSIKHLLTEHDIWEEIIGSTLYGGSRWSLKIIEDQSIIN